MMASVIESAHKMGRKVGICGQAPSDYPDIAAFLVRAGIDSISLNPDSVIQVKKRVAQTENDMKNHGRGRRNETAKSRPKVRVK